MILNRWGRVIKLLWLSSRRKTPGLRVCGYDGHGEWGRVVLGRVGAAEGQNRFNALYTKKCSAAPCG